MRPTGIGFRSPREKTPACYSTFVNSFSLLMLSAIMMRLNLKENANSELFLLQTNQKGQGLFCTLTTPKEIERIRDFATLGRGFGRADRFLYVR